MYENTNQQVPLEVGERVVIERRGDGWDGVAGTVCEVMEDAVRVEYDDPASTPHRTASSIWTVGQPDVYIRRETAQEIRDQFALANQQRGVAVEQLEEARARLRAAEDRAQEQADMIERQHATNNVQANRINELQRDVNRLTAEARLVRENWDSDVREISAAFRREAISRGWCEEATEFIIDLNRTLHSELTPPRRTYEVSVQVLVSIPVTVEAYDEDDARQIADSEWRELWTDRDYNAREAIEEGYAQDSDSFEVEEV